MHAFLLRIAPESRLNAGTVKEPAGLVTVHTDRDFCVVLPKDWKTDGTLSVLNEILDGVSDGVYFVDRDRNILLWNRGAEELSGFKTKEVVGRCCADDILRHVDDCGTHLCVGDCPLSAAMNSGTYQEAEVFLHHKRGFRKPVLVKVKPVYDSDKKIIGAVETFCDNTRLRFAEAEIERLKSYSLYDPVAGVGNKQFIETEIRSALSAEERHRVPLAVLLIRLHGLDDVRQRHGAEIGDEAIRVMGATLTGALRAGDSLGHLSDYEFMALLMNAREKDAEAVGKRCLNLLRESSLRLAKLDLRVAVSVSGTSVRPGDSFDSILRRVADLQISSPHGGNSQISIG